MSSIQPVNVRFPALLEQPPVDRVRKRGLVYPKLAQSKGSGDRMHSPDLFWGSRRVSAAPSGPDPREAVPRGRSVHLPKPAAAAVTLPGILTLCIRDKTRRTAPRLRCFEPRYNIMGTSESESESSTTTTTSTRPGPPAPAPRSGIVYRLCCSLGSSVLESRWMMRGRSRCSSTATVTATPAMIEVEFEEVDGLFGVPSSPAHFPSTPISSYSSETSTSDRDSENSSLVVI